MRVKETKSGKYKITGLTRYQLVILKEVFDYCEDDVIVTALRNVSIMKKSDNYPESAVEFLNAMFVSVSNALAGGV